MNPSDATAELLLQVHRDRDAIERELDLLALQNERLWDSIPADAAVEVSPEQQAELQRRIAAHERSPEQLLTWDEVLRTGRPRRFRQLSDRVDHPILHFFWQPLDALDRRPQDSDLVRHDSERPRRSCLMPSSVTDSCGPFFASS